METQFVAVLAYALALGLVVYISRLHCRDGSCRARQALRQARRGHSRRANPDRPTGAIGRRRNRVVPGLGGLSHANSPRYRHFASQQHSERSHCGKSRRQCIGCIHKLTEGSSYTDDHADARHYLATSAGMAWGLYHFLRPGNMEQQAEFFGTRAVASGSASMTQPSWRPTMRTRQCAYTIS